MNEMVRTATKGTRQTNGSRCPRSIGEGDDQWIENLETNWKK